MTVRILHAHSTFSLGGKEARAVRLMNAFGGAAEHTIISGMPDQLGARAALDAGLTVHFPIDAPSLTGRFGLARLYRLSRYMRGFDLILTYNWGAFDAVMARCLFARSPDFPPLIHHEDGFNEDEAEGLKTTRNLYRRLGLSAAQRLVVPSERLEAIALSAWNQPPERIERIANGIPVERFATPPATDAIPDFRRREGEVVIGTLAGLRAVKDLPRMVRAVASLDAAARLVIVGEGPERERIQAEVAACGIADRVHLPGFLAEPARYIGLFDIFALSSLSEQFPISVVEAMAAGLPVVSPAVGDVAAMVSDANREFIVADDAAYRAALQRLVADPALRHRVGVANRAKAEAQFGEARMIERYARIYGAAISAPDAFLR